MGGGAVPVHTDAAPNGQLKQALGEGALCSNRRKRRPPMKVPLDARRAQPIGLGARLRAGKAAQEVQGFLVPTASHFKAEDDEPAALRREELWVGVLAFGSGRLLKILVS